MPAKDTGSKLLSAGSRVFEVPTRRGSGDAVLRTDADRIEHANEMGTSELYRTSIMLAAIALTTDRSMHPGRSQEKATDQESGSIVQRTGPQTGGAFRKRKTA